MSIQLEIMDLFDNSTIFLKLWLYYTESFIIFLKIYLPHLNMAFENYVILLPIWFIWYCTQQRTVLLRQNNASDIAAHIFFFVR
jgi:hypothetical protein